MVLDANSTGLRNTSYFSYEENYERTKVFAVNSTVSERNSIEAESDDRWHSYTLSLYNNLTRHQFVAFQFPDQSLFFFFLRTSKLRIRSPTADAGVQTQGGQRVVADCWLDIRYWITGITGDSALSIILDDAELVELNLMNGFVLYVPREQDSYNTLYSLHIGTKSTSIFMAPRSPPLFLTIMIALRAPLSQNLSDNGQVKLFFVEGKAMLSSSFEIRTSTSIKEKLVSLLCRSDAILNKKSTLDNVCVFL